MLAFNEAFKGFHESQSNYAERRIIERALKASVPTAIAQARREAMEEVKRELSGLREMSESLLRIAALAEKSFG